MKFPPTSPPIRSKIRPHLPLIRGQMIMTRCRRMALRIIIFPISECIRYRLLKARRFLHRLCNITLHLIHRQRPKNRDRLVDSTDYSPVGLLKPLQPQPSPTVLGAGFRGPASNGSVPQPPIDSEGWRLVASKLPASVARRAMLLRDATELSNASGAKRFQGSSFLTSSSVDIVATKGTLKHLRLCSM